MKPILFNTDMTRTILDGRKTVTRRLIKHPYYIDKEDVCRKSRLAMHIGINITHGMPYPENLYDKGDILYVRETWSVDNHNWLYRADFSDTDLEKLKNIMRWAPSIHMPKKIARIFLRVTDVRVERLQDIKIADIISEGVSETCQECFENYGNGYQCCIGESDECGIYDDTISNWQNLWDSTIKKSDLDKYGWNANPWVWVIEFERISKEEALKTEKQKNTLLKNEQDI